VKSYPFLNVHISRSKKNASNNCLFDLESRTEEKKEEDSNNNNNNNNNKF
jgi:hypothetical protein